MDGSSSSQGMGHSLTAAELLECVVDGVPAEGIVERREDDVLRQALVQIFKMARHATPSAEYEPLAGGVTV